MAKTRAAMPSAGHLSLPANGHCLSPLSRQRGSLPKQRGGSAAVGNLTSWDRGPSMGHHGATGAPRALHGRYMDVGLIHV